MSRCPSCSSEVLEGGGFCPMCGAALGPHSALPTRMPGPAAPSSSGAFGESRFLPGTILAGRYRIYGLLGRGGMGEVYRADDLKLGQAVALKLLPESVERDRTRLSRFLNEAKIARQISHPNVCRVYDVGEVDGHHFLSMEYVDGEDLRGLLKRIGRLPSDKAVQIARQIASGLAAAHEQGVLHRDLKPANVMIDGRGRARITDFGLAVVADEIPGDERNAGTPAYMAPEQLGGEGASTKSDIYSLGLVLYEIFTGKPAFRAASASEIRRLKNESTPASPSDHVENLDAATERVILRCLEKDPRSRPASALSIVAALPGGNPLAAAIAAGETPSPELVAEAGVVGGLSPRAAVAAVAALVIGFALVIYLSERTQLSRIVPLPKPPEVLAERAREILRSLGYTEAPGDEIYRFDYSKGTIDDLVERLPPPAAWRRLGAGPPFAVHFWYRRSPGYLAPQSPVTVMFEDPPWVIAGMVGLRLEPDGRLKEVEAVPPSDDPSSGPWAEPPWNKLFEEAGLELSSFEPVPPSCLPPVYADRRAAWVGANPGLPDSPVRIEGASYHGKPVSFRILEGSDRPASPNAQALRAGDRIARFASFALELGILVGGLMLARRNLRLGRGDRKGASTLAIVVLVALLVDWLVRTHHIPDPNEAGIFFRALAFRVLIAGVIWVFYLAIEPYLRRIWPDGLVSWVRVLDGRLRDPLVGRDIVFGLLAGLGFTLAAQAWPLASRWLNLPLPPFDVPPYWQEFENLSGLHLSMANLVEVGLAGPFFAFGNIVLLLLLRGALRKQSVAIAAYVLILSLLSSPSLTHPWGPIFFNGIQVAFFIAVFLRLGLLASTVAGSVQILLTLYTMTFDLSAWYATNTILILLVAGALMAWGLRTALPRTGGIRDPILAD